MKFHFDFLLRIVILCAVTACAPAVVQTQTATLLPSPAGSSLHGIFEGITPCSAQTRLLPQISADTDCELMIWKIALYQDSGTDEATTYTLESTYGVSQPNSTGPAGGGTAISMEGNWSMAKGTKANPEADVYQLFDEDTNIAVSFVKMSEDILHVLNRDQTLMLGNAAWSYTLNRTDNRAPVALDGPVSAGPEATRPPIPEMPAGSALLGAYEGRVPCHEVAYDVLNLAPYSGCLKLKSRLTLYVDRATGAPTSYMYMGTSTIREGKWTILRGAKDDPDAVVYQLQLEGSKPPVFFLKADDNHLFLLDRDLNLLVGNALFSYTLSRIK